MGMSIGDKDEQYVALLVPSSASLLQWLCSASSGL